MNSWLSGPLIMLALLLQFCSSVPAEPLAQRTTRQECSCDSACLWPLVMDTAYGHLAAYDLQSVRPDTLYDVSAEACRLLWFRDIESPDTTRFTRSFNGYFRNHYSADDSDFVAYYRDHKTVPLAFQLGPNDDLWAFHSFIVKPISGCYLITHSYYRHARFTMKEFAFLDKSGLDALRTRLVPLRPEASTAGKEEYYYGLGVCDNELHQEYVTSMEEGGDTTTARYRAIRELYDHLDHRIQWRPSYN